MQNKWVRTQGIPKVCTLLRASILVKGSAGSSLIRKRGLVSASSITVQERSEYGPYELRDTENWESAGQVVGPFHPLWVMLKLLWAILRAR